MAVEVVEFYRSYEPPPGVRPAVEAVLARLPERYLLGLGSVVLRDVGSLVGGEKRGKTWSRAKKAGGRGVRYTEVMGLYRRGRPASIDLFVDQILHGTEAKYLRSPLVLEVALGSTLFHELGHHLHVTQAREHREREEVAERWRRTLLRTCFGRGYFLRRYWRVPRLVFAALRKGNRWGIPFLVERSDVGLLAMPVILPVMPIYLCRWVYRKLRRRLRRQGVEAAAADGSSSGRDGCSSAAAGDDLHSAVGGGGAG